MCTKKGKGASAFFDFLRPVVGPLAKSCVFFLGFTQKNCIFGKKKEREKLSYVKKGNYFFALRRANPALKNNQVGAIVALRSLKTSILSEREREGDLNQLGDHGGGNHSHGHRRRR